MKDWVEGLKRLEKPDVVLCHQRNDAHQDHRMVCELAWNTFRDHLILEYEIPKYDGDFGSPNFFACLPKPTTRCRIAFLPLTKRNPSIMMSFLPRKNHPTKTL